MQGQNPANGNDIEYHLRKSAFLHDLRLQRERYQLRHEHRGVIRDMKDELYQQEREQQKLQRKMDAATKIDAAMSVFVDACKKLQRQGIDVELPREVQEHYAKMKKREPQSETTGVKDNSDV